MSEAQKKIVAFWTKLLLIGASSSALTIGMFMGNEIALTIVAILCVLFFAYIIAVWVAQRVYLWRIAGILTVEEYEVVKWYRFSLLEKGPEYILDHLKEDTILNPFHIDIFTKVAEVKIPKILLDKSKEA